MDMAVYYERDRHWTRNRWVEIHLEKLCLAYWLYSSTHKLYLLTQCQKGYLQRCLIYNRTVFTNNSVVYYVFLSPFSKLLYTSVKMMNVIPDCQRQLFKDAYQVCRLTKHFATLVAIIYTHTYGFAAIKGSSILPKNISTHWMKGLCIEPLILWLEGQRVRARPPQSCYYDGISLPHYLCNVPNRFLENLMAFPVFFAPWSNLFNTTIKYRFLFCSVSNLCWDTKITRIV